MLDLSNLRFLVVDEADRLLGQAYGGWVDKVLAAAYAQSPSPAVFTSATAAATAAAAAAAAAITSSSSASAMDLDGMDRESAESWPVALSLRPTTVRAHPSQQTLDAGAQGGIKGVDDVIGGPVRRRLAEVAATAPVPLQRMLFSATLSRDPAKVVGGELTWHTCNVACARRPCLFP